jgi:hypothetical protein
MRKMAAESIGQWSLREDKNSVAASACGCPLLGVKRTRGSEFCCDAQDGSGFSLLKGS